MSTTSHISEESNSTSSESISSSLSVVGQSSSVLVSFKRRRDLRPPSHIVLSGNKNKKHKSNSITYLNESLSNASLEVCSNVSQKSVLKLVDTVTKSRLDRIQTRILDFSKLRKHSKSSGDWHLSETQQASAEWRSEKIQASRNVASSTKPSMTLQDQYKPLLDFYTDSISDDTTDDEKHFVYDIFAIENDTQFNNNLTQQRTATLDQSWTTLTQCDDTNDVSDTHTDSSDSNAEQHGYQDRNSESEFDDVDPFDDFGDSDDYEYDSAF